jgi:hypothetical protein
MSVLCLVSRAKLPNKSILQGNSAPSNAKIQGNITPLLSILQGNMSHYDAKIQGNSDPPNAISQGNGTQKKKNGQRKLTSFPFSNQYVTHYTAVG